MLPLRRVLQEPSHISRHVSVVETQDETGISCYSKDETVIMDWSLLDWQSYIFEFRNEILYEHARLGVKLIKGGQCNSRTKLSKLKEANNKFNRKIRALKKKNPSADQDDDKSNYSDKKEEPIDAGDRFGGKAWKKRKKND